MSVEVDSAHRALAFTRHGSRWIVSGSCVAGVIPAPCATAMPATPRALLGLLGWRGEVVPLVDPCASADGPPRAPVAALVLQATLGMIAVATDTVEGWTALPDGGALLEPEQLYRQVRTAVLRGEHEPDRAASSGVLA